MIKLYLNLYEELIVRYTMAVVTHGLIGVFMHKIAFRSCGYFFAY